MKGIEVNVQTGQQRTVELTAKEVEQQRLAYEASQKLATWDDIRAKRDQLIRESDWAMIPDASVDQAQWAAYRQILRDLPQTYAESGPESVVWPTQPSTAGPNSTPVE
jgi:hypothetical protein